MTDPQSGRGVVAWLTGLPASGKSTLARALASRVPGSIVLDGDDVRAALRPAPGYEPAARDAFYETLARLAALLARQGHTVIVAATAPERGHRARARSLAPAFIEIWVDTPKDECVRRDPKGLYARAALDAASTLPGVGVPYEPPESPDVVVRPADRDPLSAIVSQLERARA